MQRAISIEVRFEDGTSVQVEGDNAAAVWEWMRSAAQTEMCNCGRSFPGGLGIERMQAAS